MFRVFSFSSLFFPSTISFFFGGFTVLKFQGLATIMHVEKCNKHVEIACEMEDSNSKAFQIACKLPCVPLLSAFSLISECFSVCTSMHSVFPLCFKSKVLQTSCRETTRFHVRFSTLSLIFADAVLHLSCLFLGFDLDNIVNNSLARSNRKGLET